MSLVQNKTKVKAWSVLLDILQYMNVKKKKKRRDTLKEELAGTDYSIISVNLSRKNQSAS